MTQVFVIRNGAKIARFTTVNELVITYTGNGVPTCTLTMDAQIIPYITRRCELLIDHCGETIRLQVNSADCSINNKTVSITTEHIFIEWDDESVPINLAVKDKSIPELMSDDRFVYLKNPWKIEFDDSDEVREKIDFEFSRESKSESLNKMLTQTETLLKRFPRNRDRTLQIGVFGEKKEYRIPTSQALDDISMEMDGSSVCNMVVPLSDKGDGGASTLTLRDVFVFRDGLQNMFPIVLTGKTINTQSTQTGYDFPQYAPNNKNEYAVMDARGIEMEDGEIFEGTYSANDLQPIEEEGKTISNLDRLKASKALYKSAIRYLKNHRRQLSFKINLPELPRDVDVLDRVSFQILLEFPQLTEGMTPFEEEIYRANDWFYITDITMTADGDSWTYALTLSKDLAGIYGNGVN